MSSNQGQTPCSTGGTGPTPEDLAAQAQMRQVTRTMLVLSGKGGVGKSTVAVNLATALARTGKTVGLLDVDVHGPSIPKMLHLEDQRAETVNGQIMPVRAAENLLVMSVGLLLPRLDEPIIWRGPMKHSVIRQLLGGVDWGRLDYLVVDAPPGTGDEPLSIAQLAGPNAEAVIVTTPQDVAVSDVRRCIAFCEQVSARIIGIVENMSGWVCPHCGERTDLLTVGGGMALAEELGLAMLGQIPIDPSVVASGDAGMPFAGKTDSPAAKAFASVVSEVLAIEDTADDRVVDLQAVPDGKIAIPLVNGCLCMHFGHCEQFALVTTDEDGAIVDTTLLTPPPHEPGVLPAWLNEQGASVIIAGGMGQRARELFGSNGISVVVGAEADTPEKLVQAYLTGTLATGENACEH